MCSKRKIVILKTEKIKIRLTKKTAGVTNGDGSGMIYCVEDERNIRELLVYTLETTGFEAEGFETGVEFDAAMKKSLPELILLDIMLPGEDGYNILKRLKSDTRTRDIPVIMVTAKEAEFDKVKGLEGGADDYITKPFEIKEVVARVAVQLRHAVADVPSKSGQAGENQTKAENETGQGDTANTYIAGPAKIEHRQLVLDRISRQLYVADNAVDGITKQEFAILELLMAHPRQVFAKEDIFEYAWDEPYIGETKTLDVHISNIRKKIKKLTDDEYIETVWGIGYKMKE